MLNVFSKIKVIFLNKFFFRCVAALYDFYEEIIPKYIDVFTVLLFIERFYEIILDMGLFKV